MYGRDRARIETTMGYVVMGVVAFLVAIVIRFLVGC
jgi:hypothetical protein